MNDFHGTQSSASLLILSNLLTGDQDTPTPLTPHRGRVNWLDLVRMTLQGSSSIGNPFPLVYLALSVFLLAAPGHPGCQEVGLCCSGRNVSCVSKGWKPDHSYGTCYCDQACVTTLDCCHDYETACPGKPVRTIKSTLIISIINDLLQLH